MEKLIQEVIESVVDGIDPEFMNEWKIDHVNFDVTGDGKKKLEITLVTGADE